MTKDQLWQSLIEKHSQFGNPKAEITLKQPGLKKLFNVIWDAGYDYGLNFGEEPLSKSNYDDGQLDDLMKLFGMKK